MVKNQHGLSPCVFACLENKYDTEILPSYDIISDRYKHNCANKAQYIKDALQQK